MSDSRQNEGRWKPGRVTFELANKGEDVIRFGEPLRNKSDSWVGGAFARMPHRGGRAAAQAVFLADPRVGWCGVLLLRKRINCEFRKK